MKPSRTSQPYRRKGGRMAGNALANMLRGARMDGKNPMDSKRRLAKKAGKKRKRRPTKGRRIRHSRY